MPCAACSAQCAACNVLVVRMSHRAILVTSLCTPTSVAALGGQQHIADPRMDSLTVPEYQDAGSMVENVMDETEFIRLLEVCWFVR